MGDGLRIAVFAEQPLVREAVSALLRERPEVADVQEASDLRTLAAILGDEPHERVVVVAPRSQVPQTIRELTVAHRGTPTLVLAPHPVGAADVRAAVAAGASGVLTADATGDDLLRALRSIVDGTTYIHPVIGALLVQDDGLGPVEQLSPREREVLRLIGLGMTNPEIARVLVVSPRTVETHRARLTRKLQAQSRADLVRYALRSGLVSETD